MPKKQITMNDSINHSEIGFDNRLYKKLQKEAILDRLSKFQSGTLYIEIGGHFLHDTHAARVLPGFKENVKPEIFAELKIPYNIIFCVSAKDLHENRMLTEEKISYENRVLEIIQEHADILEKEIIIAINIVSDIRLDAVKKFEKKLKEKEFKSFRRYVIHEYPDADKVISETGYGKDEFSEQEIPMTLIIGPASNSGKLSTALGQVYHDLKRGRDSGYAKFELFPIWDLPLDHPINRAYEAATADIGDYNEIDLFHLKGYGIEAVNYNRDIQAFPIIKALIEKLVPKSNYISTYKSPTAMGMNTAGSALTKPRLAALASVEEIKRREKWYIKQAKEGRGEMEWATRCNKLAKMAEKYIKLHCH